jgi:hypothetical protein
VRSTFSGLHVPLLWRLAMTTPVYMACDAANVDATTGQCSQPIWLPQPQLFPQLDAADGITIAVAILACWATAYGFRSLRRAGE